VVIRGEFRSWQFRVSSQFLLGESHGMFLAEKELEDSV
jgi:hypothetical protein